MLRRLEDIGTMRRRTIHLAALAVRPILAIALAAALLPVASAEANQY